MVIAKRIHVFVNQVLLWIKPENSVHQFVIHRVEKEIVLRQIRAHAIEAMI